MFSWFRRVSLSQWFVATALFAVLFLQVTIDQPAYNVPLLGRASAFTAQHLSANLMGGLVVGLVLAAFVVGLETRSWPTLAAFGVICLAFSHSQSVYFASDERVLPTQMLACFGAAGWVYFKQRSALQQVTRR